MLVQLGHNTGGAKFDTELANPGQADLYNPRMEVRSMRYADYWSNGELPSGRITESRHLFRRRLQGWRLADGNALRLRVTPGYGVLSGNQIITC